MDYITEIHKAGRITIPIELRKEFGLVEGDKITIRKENGELKLLTQQQALDEAYALLRQYVPASVSLVNELIQERREEAAKEEQEQTPGMPHA